MMLLCSIDVINRHQIFLYVAFFLFILTPKRKIRLDVSFLLLSLFSFTLILFNPLFQKGVTDMLKAFNYPLCYLMGTSLFISNEKGLNNFKNAESGTRTAIYIIAIGTFIHYFLNMLINLGRRNREVIEFWSRKELSATGQATYACIVIGVIAATLFSNTSKKQKIAAIIALIIVMAYNLILSGRTLFVLIAIALLVAYFYKSYVNKTNVLKTVLILTLIVIIAVFLFSANVFGIKTAFENSNFYNRFYGGEYTQDIDEDTRMEHKTYYLTHLGDSVFGGGKIRQAYGHSAHDLYLDTYDESGIFAVLFIIIYILVSLYKMLKCLKNKQLSLETKQLVLGVYLLVNIMFFMEPIIRGSPWLLFSYCFIDGAVSHMLNHIPPSAKNLPQA